MTDIQRIALITGANRGLGFETARQLLQKRYVVILTSRDTTLGQNAVNRLYRIGKVLFHPLDVSDPDSINTVYKFVDEQLGRLDILINNAGIYADENSGILEIPLEILQTTLETNTIGPLLLCQKFLPMMVTQNYGRVVNVSSGMGEMNDVNNYAPAYRISKLALNGLTRILADAVRGKNVLVNAVCPGWARTDMGGSSATRSIEHGTEGIVWAATLPNGGPNGGFFRDGQPISW